MRFAMSTGGACDLKIHENEPSHFEAFVALNERWIIECFELEDPDAELRRNPEAVIEKGGYIFTVLDDETVVGTCALFRAGEHEFELARMAVDPGHQRRGIGKALAEHALERAREEGATRVFLLTNTILRPALSLYRTLGFGVVEQGQHPEYSRCNVVMEKSL